MPSRCPQRQAWLTSGVRSSESLASSGEAALHTGRSDVRRTTHWRGAGRKREVAPSGAALRTGESDVRRTTRRRGAAPRGGLPQPAPRTWGGRPGGGGEEGMRTGQSEHHTTCLGYRLPPKRARCARGARHNPGQYELTEEIYARTLSTIVSLCSSASSASPRGPPRRVPR